MLVSVSVCVWGVSVLVFVRKNSARSGPTLTPTPKLGTRTRDADTRTHSTRLDSNSKLTVKPAPAPR